jgi:hypothetical protein
MMIPPSYYFRLLIATVRQHGHHSIVVRFRNEHIDIEMTFSLIGFLRQYVPRMRMATLDLSGGCQSHSLCGAFMSF